MNPYVLEVLARMRVAELHRQAERSRLVSFATLAAKVRRRLAKAAPPPLQPSNPVGLLPRISALLGGASRAPRAGRPVVRRRRSA